MLLSFTKGVVFFFLTIARAQPQQGSARIEIVSDNRHTQQSFAQRQIECERHSSFKPVSQDLCFGDEDDRFESPPLYCTCPLSIVLQFNDYRRRFSCRVVCDAVGTKNEVTTQEMSNSGQRLRRNIYEMLRNHSTGGLTADARDLQSTTLQPHRRVSGRLHCFNETRIVVAWR